jgi:eukaryotic-like serine/threonine-protein kinase
MIVHDTKKLFISRYLRAAEITLQPGTGYFFFHHPVHRPIINLSSIKILADSKKAAFSGRDPMSMIGKKVAHYEIISQLGKGGMGEVFLASDTSLNRKVAVKFLPESLERDETVHKRFMREARSAAALDHPYICSIHEVGEAEGRSYIVMEYVEGQTLKDRLAHGEVPLKDVVQWAVEIAEALAVAHEKGIIHRDLKPSNIMISQTGHAKVMDFGLAKQIYGLPESRSQEETLTGLTREGTTVGTIPYMSPEQVQGKTVDFRSDLFSFGIVLYEMLSGVNPFKKETSFNTADAIRRETPPPLSKYREDVPQQLEDLIRKLLSKEPADRIRQARDMAEVLKKVLNEISGEQIVSGRNTFAWMRNTLRKPVYLIPLILILAGSAYFSIGGLKSYQKSKWAREVAPKEVDRLMEQDRPVAAARVLREGSKYAPESRELNQLKALLLAGSITIQTTPPDAEIYIRDYAGTDDGGPSNWELLGRSPFTSQAFPSGYHRFRLVKDGFEPIEIGGPLAFSIQRRLHPKQEIPEGMVWVRRIAKGEQLPPVAPENAAEFWMDKYEVTNQQFKKFVDAGGYQNREYWKQPFIKDRQRLAWEEAMALFRDGTGKPGPATWEFGAYPEGEADFPVGGVSWYEAAAYAEFAGKNLPTVYHWKCAGSVSVYADIQQYSNFSAKGPAKVGTYHGLGDFGTYDMAGNIKEWCWNEIEGRRYILGGAWNEPAYLFTDPDARQPFDRGKAFGFRCVKYTEPQPKALAEPVAFYGPSLDRRKDLPADNRAYSFYLNLHAYDKTALNPSIESVDETSSKYWKTEKATFQAAYGNERMIADLYFPMDAKPPYQPVIYMPGADAFYTRTLSGVNLRFISFVLNSGRAMIVPHYKGTLDRDLIRSMPYSALFSEPIKYRERSIQWSKDLGRTIDYLETRNDIDTGRISYIGVSWGAYVGPRLVAVEPRIKAAVFAAGGDIPDFRMVEEVDPYNFAPRVKVPVLMQNGKSDFSFPLETRQLPLFNLLGTPEKDKSHLLYEGGHEIFDQKKVFRDMLDWLDRYLGPASIQSKR